MTFYNFTVTSHCPAKRLYKPLFNDVTLDRHTEANDCRMVNLVSS